MNMSYHVEQRKSYLPGKWTEYRPHRRNTKDCLLLFDILGISAKKPVNWNIFIYQGNKSEIATRPHFMGATGLWSSHVSFLRAQESYWLPAPIWASQALVLWGTGPKERRNSKISEDRGSLPGFAAHLSVLRWISLEYVMLQLYPPRIKSILCLTFLSKNVTWTPYRK